MGDKLMRPYERRAADRAADTLSASRPRRRSRRKSIGADVM